jgi:hypothetical protein
VGSGQESCINNIGSFFCVDIDNEEYLGIGTGGTSAMSYLGKPVVIDRDMISCSFSNIPTISSKSAHGMAALDNWLFICGGTTAIGSDPGTSCNRYDLNNISGTWITSPPIPSERQDFGFVSLNGFIYFMGGRDYDSRYTRSYSKSDVYRFSLQTNAWAPLAPMPIPVFSQCIVTEEDTNKIWSIAGSISFATGYTSGSVSDVYTYNANTNKWFLHSYLNYSTYYSACSMVTTNTRSRYIYVVSGVATTNNIQYWNLNTNMGWYTFTSTPVSGQIYMRMLSLSPYTMVLVAGDTDKYGRSHQNFFKFNLDSLNFESGWNYLLSEMYTSAWIRVKRSYRSLANCRSVIKYAAVGWGGGTTTSPTAYTTQWDVLLRSRSTSRMYEPSSPVRCDIAIPDLSPGKFSPGIASVGYWLIVCGGNQYGKPAESTCVYLDTNQETSAWTAMQSMPVARGDFPLVTYGDAVFAIGGFSSSGYLKQVDRWTQTLGWRTVTPYPGAGLSRHCAVADEGYDKLYSLGAYRCIPNCIETSEAYQYVVSTNTWSTFPNLPTSSSEIACTIVRRSRTGNRVIIVTGNGSTRIYFFDLVSGSSWSYFSVYKTDGWSRPKVVSVTPWEVYLMGGYCNGCGYG